MASIISGSFRSAGSKQIDHRCRVWRLAYRRQESDNMDEIELAVNFARLDLQVAPRKLVNSWARSGRASAVHAPDQTQYHSRAKASTTDACITTRRSFPFWRCFNPHLAAA
jgi:hypothetical protein